MRKYQADLIRYLPPRRAEVVSGEWRVVAPANPQRRALFIVNVSDVVICLAFGDRPSGAVPAGEERGAVLFPNGGAYNMTDDNLSTQAIYARHGDAGNKNLSVQEAVAPEEAV